MPIFGNEGGVVDVFEHAVETTVVVHDSADGGVVLIEGVLEVFESQFGAGEVLDVRLVLLCYGVNV